MTFVVSDIYQLCMCALCVCVLLYVIHCLKMNNVLFINNRPGRMSIRDYEFNLNEYATVRLLTNGKMVSWNTEYLYDVILSARVPYNPVTRQPLCRHEIKNIIFSYDSLMLDKRIRLSNREILYYFVNGGDATIENYARHLLNIEDFCPGINQHVDRNTLLIRRDQSIEQLKASRGAKWLLRQSSLNHPQTTRAKTINATFGLKFYVMSFKMSNNVAHNLFMYRPGYGWCLLTSIVYCSGNAGDNTSGNGNGNGNGNASGDVGDCDDDFQVKCGDKQPTYYVCFVDVLMVLLMINKLKITDQLSQHLPQPQHQQQQHLQQRETPPKVNSADSPSTVVHYARHVT